ncbi:MAG: DinB family protein [Polyangiales bacterium]
MPMSLEWLAALARYNRWMNDKLYGLAATLTDEARKRDVGAFFKSIHGTFNHLLVADRIWLGRFRGETFPEGFIGPGGIRAINDELYSDFDELRRERLRTDDDLSAWVAGLSEAQLAAPLAFVRRGARFESPLWWSVTHVFNHQTHHRGQVTTILNQLGIDPGVTDLYAMFLEEQARAAAR